MTKINNVSGSSDINPATKYAVFRASDKRQIKAQLAGKTHCIRFSHQK